jgi:predicted NAD/FAD-binding protein
MPKIAIIGSGISGLASAYFLKRKHDITLYEKEDRLGGHSRTVTVRHGDRIIPVDTGFIVFNERNYPNLTALFSELKVPVKDSDMTYAMSVGDGEFEWGAQDLNTIFGQRRNILRPSFYRLFGEVMRFNRAAEQQVTTNPTISLGDLISSMGLSESFRQLYLLPMSGAIWSSPPNQMLAFPAKVFVDFFRNHGLLAMSGQPQWRTVDGGSREYVSRIAAELGDSVKTGCAATSVRRDKDGIRVTDTTGATTSYDHVVFACHTDEALGLLADATSHEAGNLAAIRYQRNDAVLHRDPRFMPRRERCWASWNYKSDGKGNEPSVSVTYWMNRLQGIDRSYPLFVTLNPQSEVAASDIFDRHVFHHPVFDAGAIRAQSVIAGMQGQNNTWFCGAWMRHGFHEDGLHSALKVVSRLDCSPSWAVLD